jgi:gliding motility-associated-like protein
VPLKVDYTVNVTNVPSIIWDFNDGNTMIANNTNPVSHTYTTPGAYVPKIIFSDGGSCTSSSPGTDTIKADGVFSGFTNTPACEGYMVQFIDTSKGMFAPVTNWAWTFHDGKTSVTSKPYHYYPNVGTYNVSLIVTNGNGCKDTVSRDVVINPLPVIGAGSDTIICLKDFALLDGTGGVSYAWSPAGTLSCADCPQPKASPQIKTEYTVIGTDANGCSDTDKVMIDVKIKTDSRVGEGGEICDDEGMTIQAFDAQWYEWSPAEDVSDPKSPTTFASPHKTTNFMVVAYEGSCIPDTNYIKVIVHPKPIVRATGETTIIAGKSTPIEASGELIKRFEWVPASSLSCDDCPNPQANPTKTTTYNITAYTDKNCADSAKVTIYVVCDNSQLFIPNTFTPNGDGQNDVFYPRGVGLDQVAAFRIYNRWGQVVFERTNMKLNDKASAWDGTFGGKELSPDVFVYTVEAVCDNGEILKLKGDITLVR